MLKMSLFEVTHHVCIWNEPTTMSSKEALSFYDYVTLMTAYRVTTASGVPEILLEFCSFSYTISLHKIYEIL